MIWLNKAQKAVQQAHLNEEKRMIALLQEIYERAIGDCEKKIRTLSMRDDLENLKSIIYRKEYQQALKKQLDGILDILYGEEFETISDYLEKCYENGYTGAMYDLINQGIPIIMPINQDQVVMAVQTDSKLSVPLYDSLGEDIERLKNSIRSELSRGIANGSSWNEMAKQIAKGMNSPFKKVINRAIMISRTEGHRIQQKSALDAQYKAKESGADIVKQWDSTMDKKTRPHHRHLDGQIRELDEDFEVEGMTAKAPGYFGKAKEDCNCRCCLLQRARWALDKDELNELKERAAYFGLDKTKDFEDFKRKYIKAQAEFVAKTADFGIIKAGTTKEVADVHTVGKIDREIYKCITDDIVTDEVIITDNQIQHIKDRHPNDYERFASYFAEIVKAPDYIIEANKPNTALILKEIRKENEVFKTVLRLVTSNDNPQYKNSIITFMKIDEKEWNRLLRNKNVLYRRE